MNGISLKERATNFGAKTTNSDPWDGCTLEAPDSFRSRIVLAT